uniref:Cytochrome P450 2J6 n=1 Tax=Heterorhabditis bacteriophora TaxID=37862 RepID=A0A1I7XCK1_HETBA
MITDGEPKDFIEAYLREMSKQTNNKHFGRLTLCLSAGDLWTGGMETTVTTLRWGIIYFLYYPTVQKKCQQEIDKRNDGKVK